MYSDSKTYTDYRPHQRRDKHCADDDGGGIGVKAERRYENSDNKDNDIGASERHTLSDSGLRLLLRQQIGRQIEIFSDIVFPVFKVR